VNVFGQPELEIREHDDSEDEKERAAQHAQAAAALVAIGSRTECGFDMLLIVHAMR
jgi:hypothetical protein